MRDIDAYWQDGLPNIDGWVNERWLPYLKLINEMQGELGIEGHAAEIGVFHGKLLIALAHLMRPGSNVAALDVFDDQARNIDGAGVGSLEHLRANIQAYGPDHEINYSFTKKDSSALNCADKVDLVRDHGPFRLFSVDGCHTAEHTLSDLLTAQDCLASGGVVLLDDMFQPHWPGVTEAVALFHGRYVPRIKPFLYIAHKMFFAGHGWHSDFLRGCSDRFGAQDGAKMTQMFGHPVLSVFP